MKTAKYYEWRRRGQLQCNLCPHHCVIGEGKAGICKVRKNIDGDLLLTTYGIVSSVGFDPIEKKPLYHFYPGSIIFSVGNFGCNLRCKFCQNWQISQTIPDDINHRKKYGPGELVNMALGKNTNIGIAYTYNEPIVWFEYMVDIAEAAKKEGLKNVMVTNGFINPQPLDELLGLIDAFNVDLKAFTEDFYRNQTISKLKPVKETLIKIRKSGRHLEITNLLITGHNDDTRNFTEMVKWIAGELGEDTVLHLSRYFPTYKMSAPPTSLGLLEEFYGLAKEKLNHVYLGNISTTTGQHTFCSNCGQKVIDRSRYNTWLKGLDDKGRCTNCGQKVIENM
ncbi:MAG: AmmeMemoRadiSam system radical SAM enzyme [Bacteroidetes bacterium 4572_114]|nr:MAG: AmmeMemoRadiSam system radical SAM enzyme [Bacteroidetes bacterium 4572_114]